MLPTKTAQVPIVPISAIAFAFAAVPIGGAVLWALFGTTDTPRPPVDLLPIWGACVLLVAVLSGMKTSWFRGQIPLVIKVALLAFTVSVIYGIAFNALVPEWAAQRTLERMLHVFVAFALAYLLRQAGPDAALVMTAALPGMMLLHLPFVAWAYLVHFDTEWMPWGYGPMGFSHSTSWGAMLATALCAVVGLLAGMPRLGVLPKLAGFVATVVLSMALFWSGSRSGLVGILGAVLVGLFVAPREVRQVLPVALAGVALGAVASLALENPRPSYGLLTSLERSLDADGGNALGSGRFEIWRDTLDKIGNHPFFGHGVDQFTLHTTYRVAHVEPHNGVLQFLFDFGLVGGTAAIVMLVWLYARSARCLMHGGDRRGLGAFLALTGLAVMSLFSGIAYNQVSLAAVAVCFAVLIAVRKGTAPA